MARLYFGDRDPMGQTFAFLSERDKRFTVVGLVEDTHQMNLREKAPADRLHAADPGARSRRGG